jgi:hypothetical protein
MDYVDDRVRLDCDSCGRVIAQGETVFFENTADGGYLAHLDCATDGD